MSPEENRSSPMPAENRMMQTMFARQSAAVADASRIAEMAVSSWRDVGFALSPIIGVAGVAALFKRSLYLTRGAHPCLATVLEDQTQPDELTAMQSVLAQHTSATAVAANIALLQHFEDLLISLIGLSLTERLLRPVWDKPSRDQAEQDTMS
jgi:anti-sigma-K factor RskA